MTSFTDRNKLEYRSITQNVFQPQHTFKMESSKCYLPYSLCFSYKNDELFNCILRTSYQIFSYCFIMIISKHSFGGKSQSVSPYVLMAFTPTIFPNS